jgi:replication factor C small subunit
MQELLQNIFSEKYRPTNLNELIIPARIMSKIKGGIVSNLLLYGEAGVGKTSLAKALCAHFKYDYLYINASNETSIDVIRNKIISFASTLSLMNGSEKKPKVIICDEADRFSQQAFDALKAVIEQYAKNVRFIMTTNYFNKFPDPIKSRFDCINFDFSEDEKKEVMKGYVKRITEICKLESIAIENQAIIDLLRKLYPDMRKILNTLQDFKVSGLELVKPEHIKHSTNYSRDVDFFNFLTGESLLEKDIEVQIYKFVVEKWGNNIDLALTQMGTPFISWILECKPQYQNKTYEIVCIANEAQIYNATVIDPLVNLLAACFKIIRTLRG